MNFFLKKSTYNNLKNEYLIKLDTLSQWIWKNDLSRDDFEKWLENFHGIVDGNTEHEKLNSLHLLKQYMYFGIREIRQLLKVLYENKFKKPTLHSLIRKNTRNLESEFNNILNCTRFFGIGNPSSSSSLILYLFRQENYLPEDLFWNVHDIFSYSDSVISGTNNSEDGNVIQNYIFIDDITGSGTQAKNFLIGEKTNINILNLINKFNPEAKIYYFTLFNTTKSRNLLNELKNLTAISIYELDDTYKAYNDESRYFTKTKNDCFKKTKCCQKPECDRIKEVKYAKNICEKYFHLLEFDKEKDKDWYKFGFKKSELLLSFFYNTPNNTIPLFWKNASTWYNIFTRYEKFIKE